MTEANVDRQFPTRAAFLTGAVALGAGTLLSPRATQRAAAVEAILPPGAEYVRVVGRIDSRGLLVPTNVLARDASRPEGRAVRPPAQIKITFPREWQPLVAPGDTLTAIGVLDSAGNLDATNVSVEPTSSP